MTGRAAVVAAFLAAFHAASGENLQDGEISLTQTDGLITFEARNAPLDEVLAAAGRSCGVAFDANAIPERNVTARFLDITLDQLLARLDLSFGLVLSARGDEGQLHITTSEPAVDPRVALAALLMLQHRPTNMPGPETWSEDIAQWVANLHDDDVRYNGAEALWDLQCAGTSAFAALEYTLYDDDYQARQFAAEALSWNSDTNYVPSERLLQVLVEGMADDEFPWDSLGTGDTYTCVYNARTAYEFFGYHPEQFERAEPYLVHALFSDDGQQRLLAAFVLAENTSVAYAERISQILVPHLADNNLSSDAGLAAYGLYQLGDTAVPYLNEAAASEDRQVASIASYLLQLVDDPAAQPNDEVCFALSYNMSERPPISYFGWDPENFAVDPSTAKQAEPPFEYEIKQNETLDDVSYKFAVLKRDIMCLNGLASETAVVPGMKVKIPLCCP
jgi:hypothetical protein